MSTPYKVEAASTSTTPVLNTPPQELIVLIYPKHYDFSEYHGTRVMLEDEGVIPEGTKWPDGYFDLYWEDNQFKYWLRRIRPPEAKGPKKQFENVDWFCYRWQLLNQPSYQERQIKVKKQEREDIIFHHSAKVQKEWSVQYNRLLEANKDMQFQDFKALIPGLIPIKRERKTIAKEA